MLDGVWPAGGCEYCQQIEQTGGFSDRMLHNKIPNLSPAELDTDNTALTVSPTVLEVFFDNTCNLACLYCEPEVSSKIAEENKKFGAFESHGIKLLPISEKHSKELAPEFWKWMDHGFQSLKRFHFLGGEPFLQKELDVLIELIESHPNPQCELNFITNLIIPKARLEKYIEKFKRLIITKKIKRLDMTASIDCWGSAQEYIRYGINLKLWKENFEYLLSQKWITLNINQTISGLSVKSMPELITLLNEWKKIRPVGHYFSVTEPAPSYMRPNIFGRGVFEHDFNQILSNMNTNTEQEQTAISYMTSIGQEIETHERNPIELKKLLVFLNEKDRRRNTNWQETFPWLEEQLKDVV
jgi:sulfatase maturation enzyme AslB (radical SAM superfamily)